MQRTLTATAILLALSLPAFAQGGASTEPPAQGSAAQGTSAQAQSGQNTLPIDQSRLSKDDIRKIQMELNKAGFDAKDVDGVWGQDTRSALQNYQRQQNLPGDGQLNQQTLSALGVEIASQQGGSQGAGSSATGAGTGTQGSSAPPPAQSGTTGSGDMQRQDGTQNSPMQGGNPRQ
ncbi:MAG: peptidoglycan-binding protein [Hyphomicrobiaceae bacterium]